MPEFYPVGIQSFFELRRSGHTYVDKTEHIYRLTEKGNSKVYFLSRPRRFGKSLLISTMRAFFEGKKELFEGLYIYDKVTEWQAFPIIHISMSEIDFATQGLHNALQRSLEQIAISHKIELEEKSLNLKFQELIKKLSQKYDQQVVILIDEYDKPITHGIEKNNADLAEENRDIMKNFYGGLKDLDNQIRFLFITGIAKFTKVSIFSELNHLTDITLEERYSTICGYTQSELEHYFPKGIAQLATNNQLTHESCLTKIKDWYNGFSWDGKQFVYNPFSTLRLLVSSQFSNYWFDSGTPAFLIKALHSLKQVALTNIVLTISIYNSFDLRNLNVYTLLIQTGYLTIKEKLDDDIYRFEMPNKEVRNSFNEMLLGEYLNIHEGIAGASLFDIRMAFLANDINKVLKIIETLFQATPSHLFAKKNEKGVYNAVGENFFHAVIYLIFNLLGVKMQAEVALRDGRVDAIVETENHVYLFEFKKNAKPEVAIQQMKDNHYAAAYQLTHKTIHLIGVSFSIKKRGLNAWKEEIIS